MWPNPQFPADLVAFILCSILNLLNWAFVQIEISLENLEQVECVKDLKIDTDHDK